MGRVQSRRRMVATSLVMGCVLLGWPTTARAQEIANFTAITAPISAPMTIGGAGLISVQNQWDAGVNLAGCTAQTNVSWSVTEDPVTLAVNIGGALYPGTAHLTVDVTECDDQLDGGIGSFSVTLSGTDVVGLPLNCSASEPYGAFIREGIYAVTGTAAGGGTCTLGGESFTTYIDLYGTVAPTQGDGVESNITAGELVGVIHFEGFAHG